MEGILLKWIGKLNLKHDNSNYIMFYRGRNININEVLFDMFLDRVKISAKITNRCTGEVLFDEEGKLFLDKIQPCFYTYSVGGKNLDKVLWDNVGRNLEIEIKNIGY